MFHLQAMIAHSGRRWLLALVVAIFLIALRFWPFFTGQTLMFGDNYSLMVPGKLFAAEWLKKGIIPLWNPNSFGGIPLAGDINQSLWYPTTWLFVFLTPAIAVNATVVLHQLIAFIGMFGLAQRLLGMGWLANEKPKVRPKPVNPATHFWLAVLAGVLWMFSPQVSGSVNNLATLQSIVWLPMIIWAASYMLTIANPRILWRQAGLISVLLTIQLAGGYPQHVLYSGLAAFGFSAVLSWWPKKWQWWLGWGLAGLLTIGMSAWLWLPFQEVLLNSTRTLQSSAQAGAGSLHPADLIKIVVPYFFDNPRAGMKWGPQWNSMPNVSLYGTWLGLLVIGLGWLRKKWQRFDWWMLLVMGGTVVFAFGERLPFLAVLQKVSSAFRFSRGPSTILMVTTVLLILWHLRWLLYICTKLQQKPKKQQHLLWLVVSWLSLATVIGSGFVWWLATYHFDVMWKFLVALTHGALVNSIFHTAARDQVIVISIASNVFWNASALLVGWWALQRQKIVLLVLVLAVEMIYNTSGLFFFAPAAVYPTISQLKQWPAAELIKQVPNDKRILIRNYNAPYTDFSAYWEALTVREPFSDSYIDETELQSFNHLHRLSAGLTPGWNVPADVRSITGYTTLLPVDVQETWGDTTGSVAINNLPPIPLTQSQLPAWAVGYYLVDTSFTIGENLDELQLVGVNDKWKLYQFPEAKSRFRYDTDLPVKFEQLVETPNTIDVQFLAPASVSAITVADRFDVGWSAVLNGQSAEISAKNNFRTISIQPGQNHLQLTYWPASLSWGWRFSWSSLLAWILSNLIWHFFSRKKPRKN